MRNLKVTVYTALALQSGLGLGKRLRSSKHHKRCAANPAFPLEQIVSLLSNAEGENFCRELVNVAPSETVTDIITVTVPGEEVTTTELLVETTTVGGIYTSYSAEVVRTATTTSHPTSTMTITLEVADTTSELTSEPSTLTSGYVFYEGRWPLEEPNASPPEPTNVGGGTDGPQPDDSEGTKPGGNEESGTEEPQPNDNESPSPTPRRRFRRALTTPAAVHGVRRSMLHKACSQVVESAATPTVTETVTHTLDPVTETATENVYETSTIPTHTIVTDGTTTTTVTRTGWTQYAYEYVSTVTGTVTEPIYTTTVTVPQEVCGPTDLPIGSGSIYSNIYWGIGPRGGRDRFEYTQVDNPSGLIQDCCRLCYTTKDCIQFNGKNEGQIPIDYRGSGDGPPPITGWYSCWLVMSTNPKVNSYQPDPEDPDAVPEPSAPTHTATPGDSPGQLGNCPAGIWRGDGGWSWDRPWVGWRGPCSNGWSMQK